MLIYISIFDHSILVKELVTVVVPSSGGFFRLHFVDKWGVKPSTTAADYCLIISLIMGYLLS